VSQPKEAEGRGSRFCRKERKEFCNLKEKRHSGKIALKERKDGREGYSAQGEKGPAHLVATEGVERKGGGALYKAQGEFRLIFWKKQPKPGEKVAS